MAIFKNLLFDVQLFLRDKKKYEDEIEAFYADDLTISILNKIQKPLFYWGKEGHDSECLYEDILVDSEYYEITHLTKTLLHYLPLIKEELNPNLSDKINKAEDLNKQTTPLQTVENFIYSLRLLNLQIKSAEGLIEYLEDILHCPPNTWLTDSYIRKISFVIAELKMKKSMLNYEVELSNLNKAKTPEIQNEETFNNPGTERMIFLKELGIIDHLQKFECFQGSTHAMAAVISSFTNMPTSTVQSYLNPMVNPQVLQKNNPLSNEKKVKKVKQTLINFGFEPKDQNNS
ncbi:hypothetical protein [Salegentibacter sp. UBA1130]|uniref:hypothetical protein n=1 Tax=Salegentibacter sp. UBA1130 TaxID=1947451 RepID=UPI00257FB689|nr:hypothetical protein [Salegentibacter sp. UBA1130]